AALGWLAAAGAAAVWPGRLAGGWRVAAGAPLPAACGTARPALAAAVLILAAAVFTAALPRRAETALAPLAEDLARERGAEGSREAAP
ncbi:MAG: hypothetical protein JW819_11960, partial [Candidatus Krumholzibacteriota bacterium]|nr:hypothetical protein [Candidatus Krumholzibacteriota bacterium]